MKSNLCLLAFIYLLLSRVLSFNIFTILIMIIEDGKTVPVIVLSIVSGFLCLGILVCFVYHKRRVSGMVNITKQAQLE